MNHTFWQTIRLLPILLVAACVTAEPQVEVRSEALQALEPFVAYHGLSGDEHLARVRELDPQGYRPVALSISGDPYDPLFSAVWVQRPGPQWIIDWYLDPYALETRIRERAGQGYQPSVLSATGAVGGETFAVLWEKTDRRLRVRFGLPYGADDQPDTFAGENEAARLRNHEIPISFTIYGEPGNQRFAAIWAENLDDVQWDWGLTAPADQPRIFDALSGAGGRLALMASDVDGNIAGVFRDDRVGPWSHKLNLSRADYQQEFDRQLAQNRRPIAISAAGSGDATRYSAVFAESDLPLARQPSVTGDDAPGVAQLDAAMLQFMAKTRTRAGALAVARAGQILVQRGYTLAESDIPVTQPTTRFRLASVSKIVAAAEASALVANGRLRWDTQAFPFVGIDRGVPEKSGITVEQILTRSSHLPRDFPAMRTIAAQLNTSAVPIPRQSLLEYLYGMNLQYEFPDNTPYSNPAFFLLSSVIERTDNGPSFLELAKRDVLTPLGIDDVSVGSTGVNARQPGEVYGYEHFDIGPSEVDYAPEALAPYAYGGRFVLEGGEASGTLVSSAGSIARLIASYPVWNSNSAALSGRELGARYGKFEGSATGARSWEHDIDYVFLFNRWIDNEEIDGALMTTLEAIHTQL